MCSFTVAVNKRRRQQDQQQQDADFFQVTAWRELGENCSKYLAKGRKVYVSGPVNVRTYQRQDGTMGASLEVTADEIEFLSPKGEIDNNGGGTYAQPQAVPAQAQPQVDAQSGFAKVELDELPF